MIVGYKKDSCLAEMRTYQSGLLNWQFRILKQLKFISVLISVIISMSLVIVRILGSKVNVLGAKKQLEDYYTHMRGKNKEPEG